MTLKRENKRLSMTEVRLWEKPDFERVVGVGGHRDHGTRKTKPVTVAAWTAAAFASSGT